MTKRLFRQKHPILFGLLILGILFTVFWGGITFFVFRSFAPHQAEFFGPGKGGIGVIELTSPVDMAKVQPLFVEQGVWVRPFGKLVYTMPAYIMNSDDVATLTSAMVNVVAQIQ